MIKERNGEEMDWTELTIYTSTEGMEPLKSQLIDIGINGFVVEDPAELQQFIDDNSGSWDLIEDGIIDETIIPNIKIYISDDQQGRERIEKICSIIDDIKQTGSTEFGTLNTEYLKVKDEDWASSWKVHFKPFKVGTKLYIKPSWENIENDEGRIVIEIDPASSFGSGQHETTRLCLEALEEYVREFYRVIDVGTGSGILSVAAVMLGASDVIGVDIEENSVKTAQETALLNNCSDKVSFFRSDLLEGILVEKADIVIGNLFSNIIVRLIPQALEVLVEGGYLITSGIISDSLNDVTEEYKKYGLNIIEQKNIGQWHIVVGRKEM